MGSGSWEVRVKGDLSVRSDTGRVNTSPVSATQPIIRLVYNSARTITIPGEFLCICILYVFIYIH